uniref:Zgc:112185 n=1 Tax=Sinocyclocheilus grahami TaxID=75366 RepID=A0A672MYZ5_SINGR
MRKTWMARGARTLKQQPKTLTLLPMLKKLKKKKKKAGDGEDNQQKGVKSNEETSKQETTELTPDELLSRELDWCIEQLELGLRTQKTSSKQREEASRALKTLHSSKAPLVKKRQVMRAISGDYRKKIEEERARQFKLIQSAVTSARLTSVSECKPVFHRRAERNTQPTNKTDKSQGPRETIEHTNTDGDTKSFVFTKTHEEFRFNFNL